VPSQIVLVDSCKRNNGGCRKYEETKKINMKNRGDIKRRKKKDIRKGG
jgi:hypothetical protein